MATLGVGALADTLAVAPLRPATRANTSQQAGIYSLTLAISPEPLTANVLTTFLIRASDPSGAPVSDARIVCDFTMPAMPMPLMRVPARQSAPGAYACQEILTDPGAWTLTITMTPPPGGAVHSAFALQAGSTSLRAS
jgi:hypothetical protein